MNYPNGNYYTDVNDKRKIFHPTGNLILREFEESKSLRTQYQVVNETKLR